MTEKQDDVGLVDMNKYRYLQGDMEDKFNELCAKVDSGLDSDSCRPYVDAHLAASDAFIAYSNSCLPLEY